MNAKNPYLRYRVLNACFTNKQKRYWTKQELIDKLALSDLIIETRTLNHDLESMRHDDRLGYHAPIAFSRSERAYHYTDPDFSIDEVKLSSEELRSLSLAAQLLQHYKGTRVVREFEGAIDKVVRVVDTLHEHTAVPATPLIELEKAPYYRGIVYVDVLLDAIMKQQPQRIGYQKFAAQQPEDHVFHPYLLKEYKGRWYVLGYSDARSSVITLALDRIEKLTDEPIAYKSNPKLKAHDYFTHTIGITHAKGPVTDVVLWFSHQQGHYIKTQHLHPSQQIVQDDESGLTIKLKLIINFELLSLLLSYCPEVKVLQPKSLKAKLNELLDKARERNKEI